MGEGNGRSAGEQRRVAIVLLGALLVIGCRGAEPSSPTPVLPPSPGPADPQPVETWTVSGTVRRHNAGGVEIVRQGSVDVWVETDRTGRAIPYVPIGTNGRYRVLVPRDTARVRIFETGEMYQPCAVTLSMAGDVGDADVDVIGDVALLGATLPAALAGRTPTLAGVVYEQTPSGRRPLANANVSLDGAFGLGLPIAETLSDAEGRYVLCNVPHLPGLDLYALVPGFELFESGPGVLGQQTFDIEMRRLTAARR